MRRRVTDWSKLLGAVLILVGAGVIFVALAADLLGIGRQAGFGGRQIGLALAGVALLLSGIGLMTRVGERFLQGRRTLSTAYEQPDQSVLKQLTTVLLIAAWFGLVAGLLEGIQYSFILSRPGRLPYALRWLGISSQILWISPAFNVLLFSVVTGLIALSVGSIWIGSTELVAMSILSWLSIYGSLTLAGQLSKGASLLLCSGLTVTVCRWLRGRELAGVSFMRRTLSYLAAAVVLLGIGTSVGPDLQERLQVSQLPDAELDVPNVLLIVLDTLRADHLSVYGYSRATSPNIDRFAQEGVLFERAFANSSWTVASHASLMTGHYVFTHGADGFVPLDGTLPTLAEELAQRGYITAGFVANTYWVSRRSGFARGFVHFEDGFRSPGDMAVRTVYGRGLARYVLPHLGFTDILGLARAADINHDLLKWLERSYDRPFFVFLNYMDVHSPYLPPLAYRATFSDGIDGARLLELVNTRLFGARELPPEERQMAVDAYDSSLAYLDAELGSLFATLDEQGVFNNTLVILTSDHGESFGEHELFAHPNSLYREQIHVPLIIRYPREIQGGHRVSEPVGLHSIPITIFQLLEPGKPSVFPGPSITALLHPTKSAGTLSSLPVLSEKCQQEDTPNHWPVSSGWLKSLVTPEWHFIERENGLLELYNLQNDPGEFDNLADTPIGAYMAKGFENELEEMLSNQDAYVGRP